VGRSQLSALVDYIAKQEEHHQTKGFQDEFRSLLQRYEVEFDEAYVWD
jgi:putative transposase